MATDKRETIMAAAEKLFSEFGYEGTSTRMLAQEAGVNLAMISYYFGSKEQLFEEMVDGRVSKTFQALQEIASNEADYFSKMDMIVDLYVDKVFKNRHFHKIIHRELSMNGSLNREKLGEILLRNAREMISIIKSGIECGAFRQVDAELTIGSLFGSVSQSVMSGFFCSRLLGLAEDQLYEQTQGYQERLKSHLKDMMRHHLTPNK